ncbi:MAG TPA: hypothetical protein VLG47_07600 [Candidatus Saccharimonadales bacterium]|nr:hypothetical protein [Candidatus Saccharimonadales bacterium]
MTNGPRTPDQLPQPAFGILAPEQMEAVNAGLVEVYLYEPFDEPYGDKLFLLGGETGDASRRSLGSKMYLQNGSFTASECVWDNLPQEQDGLRVKYDPRNFKLIGIRPGTEASHMQGRMIELPDDPEAATLVYALPLDSGRVHDIDIGLRYGDFGEDFTGDWISVDRILEPDSEYPENIRFAARQLRAFQEEMNAVYDEAIAEQQLRDGTGWRTDTENRRDERTKAARRQLERWGITNATDYYPPLDMLMEAAGEHAIDAVAWVVRAMDEDSQSYDFNNMGLRLRLGTRLVELLEEPRVPGQVRRNRVHYEAPRDTQLRDLGLPAIPGSEIGYRQYRVLYGALSLLASCARIDGGEVLLENLQENHDKIVARSDIRSATEPV